ncbi:hypothetical protein SAMN05216593_1321, partial [Pseudomonas asturiensis]
GPVHSAKVWRLKLSLRGQVRSHGVRSSHSIGSGLAHEEAGASTETGACEAWLSRASSLPRGENRSHQQVGADLSAKGPVHSAKVWRLKLSLRGQVRSHGVRSSHSSGSELAHEEAGASTETGACEAWLSRASTFPRGVERIRRTVGGGLPAMQSMRCIRRRRAGFHPQNALHRPGTKKETRRSPFSGLRNDRIRTERGCGWCL